MKTNFTKEDKITQKRMDLYKKLYLEFRSYGMGESKAKDEAVNEIKRILKIE